jgi:hypothetical protein
MKTSLPLLTIGLLFFTARAQAIPPGRSNCPSCLVIKSDSLRKKERAEEPHIIKICACQVLALASANHKTRNYALFAERTNSKTYLYDVHKAKGILEKEKKHLAYFFYDKLNVLDEFVEVTDCRSLFTKMKKKHSSLILYDILDADCKR